jgi:predicted nucleic acid-binding protein
MALTVLFDANVLYPIALADFFLTVALETNLFRPHWSTEILDEVGRNLQKNRPDLAEGQVRSRLDAMNRAAPDALVDPPCELVNAMTNPEDDRHVLAAAVVAQASVIVTFNLRDFPSEACEPYGIEARHPDGFVANLVDLDPEGLWCAVESMASRRHRPPATPNELCDRLSSDVPNAIRALRISRSELGRPDNPHGGRSAAP